MAPRKVTEVARLTRITVRTLHHYDSIGLVRPSARSAAGYRLYSVEDLERLQQVLFFRELGFSLAGIKTVMTAQGFDRREALVTQRVLLERKVENLSAMIAAIDRALAGERMEEEGFRMFEKVDHKAYEAEARKRWGHTEAYQESRRRVTRYGKTEMEAIKREHREILEALAGRMEAGAPATDPTVLAIVERHRLHIDRWFYPCSKVQHKALGDMYVSDPRFMRTYENVRAGMAEYFRDAIVANGEGSPPMARGDTDR